MSKFTGGDMEFHGDCMGVRLVRRSHDDEHIMVEIQIEDDEVWRTHASFSSSWLDEMIEVLQVARNVMDDQRPDMYEGRQYGWKFKL